MLKSIRYFSLFLLTLFTGNTALAAKLDNPTALKFMSQYESVINSGRVDTLKQFFKFYSSPESRYIVSTFFVDPKKNEELIAQDQSEMNRDQFVELLKESFSNASAYQYTQKVDKIDLTTSKDYGIITFSYQENILFTQRDSSFGSHPDYQKTFANCNMTVVVETADINIIGLNCVRKIGRQINSTEPTAPASTPTPKK